MELVNLLASAGVNVNTLLIGWILFKINERVTGVKDRVDKLEWINENEKAL